MLKKDCGHLFQKAVRKKWVYTVTYMFCSALVKIIKVIFNEKILFFKISFDFSLSVDLVSYKTLLNAPFLLLFMFLLDFVGKVIAFRRRKFLDFSTVQISRR